MEGNLWQFHFIGQVSGCLSGLLVQNSQEAHQDAHLFIMFIKILGTLKHKTRSWPLKQLQPTVWTRQRSLEMPTNRNKTWDLD